MESPSGLRTTSVSTSRSVCCTESRGSDALMPPLSTITALKDNNDTGTEISTVLPAPGNGAHRDLGFELARGFANHVQADAAPGHFGHRARWC